MKRHDKHHRAATCFDPALRVAVGALIAAGLGLTACGPEDLGNEATGTTQQASTGCWVYQNWSGNFMIKNRGKRKCADPLSTSNNNTNVVLKSCNGTRRQRWQKRIDVCRVSNRYYRLTYYRNKAARKCAYYGNGDHVVLKGCPGAAASAPAWQYLDRHICNGVSVKNGSFQSGYCWVAARDGTIRRRKIYDGAGAGTQWTFPN